MKQLNLKKFSILSFIAVVLLLSIPFRYYNKIDDLKSNPLNYLKLSTNSSNIDLSKLPKIDTNIWYEPKIEMLIITPDDEDFINAASPLVQWKNDKGVKTIILSNFSEYPGRDNAEKIRNMIKTYYETENVKWVLLAGDAQENLIPIRDVYNPDIIKVREAGEVESEYSNWDWEYKPTDFYYADLTGSWDEDNDDIFGESAEYNKNGKDEIEWIPEVYVGRLPADTATELELMVNKTLKYETDPNIGNWMNRMLLAGGISLYSPAEDEARLTEYIWTNYVLSEMNFTHLHQTTSSFDPTSPPPPNNESILNSNNFDTHFDLGYSTVFFAGHGNPFRLATEGISTVYDNTDASSSENLNMASLFYAFACTSSSYDKNDDNIGERLIKREDAGTVGYISGLRVTWYAQNDTNLEWLNRGNAKLFWKAFFEQKFFQQGKALYESKVEYINSDKFSPYSYYFECHRKNILTYCLLGDPELDIYTNKPTKAQNPFTDFYPEGHLISTTIRNLNNKTVPFARVHLKTDDGKYRTIYADENGLVNIRLPPQADEIYNITITGHNLIPSYFNFSTIANDYKPQIVSATWSPESPSILDNICFNITAFDNHSDIESAFILLSNNNFVDYSYYCISNVKYQELISLEYELNKLDPGDYCFAFYVRNYANNSDLLYNENFKFLIPKPLMDYVLIATLIVIISFVGISFFVILKELRKQKNSIR
ncbi:MAG: C25 family cysteine peptidase [Candidatus Hodarchaeota archaeon]